MIKSNKLTRRCWKRLPRTVIMLSVIVTISIIILLFTTSHSHHRLKNSKLFDQLCQKNLPSRHHKPILLLSESEQVNHIYGQDNQHKRNMKGDTSLKDNVWDELPVRGAFYMFVRNEDLGKVRETMRSLQDRLNSKRNASYPYIFLNNQRFTPEFKKYVRMASSSPDQVYFGQIDLEAWGFPSWVDVNRADNAMARMHTLKIEHAHSQYYHQKQRYQAGLFVHHPLFDTVGYIWLVEPGTTYTCDMFYQDPFETMQLKKKKIGFALSSRESKPAMMSLWPATLHYIKQYPFTVLPSDQTIMSWLITNGEYNFCHMWTSFQIVSAEFIKSEKYKLYFHYLDLVGGFFYERWTEGPVRSIAAAMFLRKDEINFFHDVGFERENIARCPYNDTLLQRCTCDYRHNNDYNRNSCTYSLLKHINPAAADEMIAFAKYKARTKVQD